MLRKIWLTFTHLKIFLDAYLTIICQTAYIWNLVLYWHTHILISNDNIVLILVNTRKFTRNSLFKLQAFFYIIYLKVSRLLCKIFINFPSYIRKLQSLNHQNKIYSLNGNCENSSQIQFLSLIYVSSERWHHRTLINHSF